MAFRTKILTIVFIVCSFLLYAEENSDNKEVFKVNFIKNEFYYLNFPLSVSTGVMSVYDNFSSFSKLGINYDIQDSIQLNSFVGIDLNFKNYILKTAFDYNLLDNGFDFSTFQNKTYKTTVKMSFPINIGRIELPFTFGQKDFVQDSNKIKKMYVEGGLGFSLSLLDIGYFKMTSNIQNNFSYIYKENFIFSELSYNLKSIYYSRYFDIALGINCLDVIKVKSDETQFNINKKLSNFTGRINFSSNTKEYKDIYIIENENRFYPLRFILPSSNFFVSTFENFGLGLKDGNKDFLWSAGFGIGYNLFSTVPFTFQMGMDNDLNITMLISVVSWLY